MQKLKFGANAQAMKVISATKSACRTNTLLARIQAMIQVQKGVFDFCRHVIGPGAEIGPVLLSDFGTK